MEDMNLYEINSLLARLLELPDNDGKVDEETGEYFDVEALNALEMKQEEKIENCLLFSKNRRALAKAIKEEAEKMLERAAKLDKQADRADNYVIPLMPIMNKKTGIKGFETKKVKATVTESTSCPEIIDIKKLPPMYIKYTEAKVVVTPASQKADKVKLLKALRALRKAGEEAVIAGVELQVKTKLKCE